MSNLEIFFTLCIPILLVGLGLGKVWDIPVIRELAEFVVCIEDMKYDLQELPKIFYEDNIEIDLVDDDIMHHLEEFTLEKLYK